MFLNVLYVSAFEEIDNVYFHFSENVVFIYCLSLYLDNLYISTSLSNKVFKLLLKLFAIVYASNMERDIRPEPRYFPTDDRQNGYHECPG